MMLPLDFPTLYTCTYDGDGWSHSCLCGDTRDIVAGAYWRISSLIDSLMTCWMVNDALLSDNKFIILVVYLALRLEIPRISYMNTPLFDIGLIGLQVPNIAQPVIECGSQSYESY